MEEDKYLRRLNPEVYRREYLGTWDLPEKTHDGPCCPECLAHPAYPIIWHAGTGCCCRSPVSATGVKHDRTLLSEGIDDALDEEEFPVIPEDDYERSGLVGG